MRRLILSSVALCLAVGCGPAPSSPSTTSTVYTHEAFNKLILGLGATEVRQALGAPDDIMRPMHFQPDGNEGYWRYTKRTKDEATGTVDASVDVWFTRGRCDQISFMPR